VELLKRDLFPQHDKQLFEGTLLKKTWGKNCQEEGLSSRRRPKQSAKEKKKTKSAGPKRQRAAFQGGRKCPSKEQAQKKYEEHGNTTPDEGGY